MSEARRKNPQSAEIQRKATEAAKKSPKSGRFETNRAAIDWHLVSPEGEHFYIHSLSFWLRENCDKFEVEPDSKEFFNQNKDNNFENYKEYAKIINELTKLD